MAKITKAEYDALPNALKESFTAEGEDGFVLKTEDVSGLKNALKSEREQREAAEKVAKQFEGVDPVKAKQMLADAQKAEEDAKKKAGQFDEILKAKEAEWQGKYETEKQAREKLESDFAEKDVESVMVKGLSSARVISDRLEAAKKLMRESVEFERKDGKTIVKFKDETGYASEMKPEEFAAKWASKHPYLFEAEGKGGSGDKNEGGGSFNKTVISRSSIATPTSDQLDAIASGEATFQ